MADYVASDQLHHVWVYGNLRTSESVLSVGSFGSLLGVHICFWGEYKISFLDRNFRQSLSVISPNYDLEENVNTSLHSICANIFEVPGNFQLLDPLFELGPPSVY